MMLFFFRGRTKHADATTVNQSSVSNLDPPFLSFRLASPQPLDPSPTHVCTTVAVCPRTPKHFSNRNKQPIHPSVTSPEGNPDISSTLQFIRPSHPSIHTDPKWCVGKQRVLPAPCASNCHRFGRRPRSRHCGQQYRTKILQAHQDPDVPLLLDLHDGSQGAIGAAFGREAIRLVIWLHEAGMEIRVRRPGPRFIIGGLLNRW